MYVKRIQLLNYGPISRVDITCPFHDDKPKPIVLVGENGSGKSILLAHIVNGLLSAQQIVYPGNPEVDKGTVYKIRYPSYIQSGKEYSFSRIDFENDLHVRELQLRRMKQDSPHLSENFKEAEAKDVWNEMEDRQSSAMSNNFHDKQALIKSVFSNRCILYFPPNRFEEPAWLNEENLKSKAQHTSLIHLHGYTDRKIVNYSPLHDNENWLFDVAYDYRVFEIQTHQENITYRQPDNSRVTTPVLVFDGFSGRAKNLFNIASMIAQTLMPQVKDMRFGLGDRSNRVVSIMESDKGRVPNIFHLSSGEVALLNLFLSILRDYDLCETQFKDAKDIRGIVMVDEVDLHLHTRHQYEILPNLVKMFPRVQFVITTHSPLFVLGLQKTFGDDGFALYHLPQGEPISPEEFGEFGDAYQAFSRTRRHSEAITNAIRNSRNPIVFVDGKTDVKYLTRAMDLLGLQKTFRDIEIRDGAGQLKNIWKGLTRDHVEHQVVVLLYDCDDKVEPSERENVFRWTIPQIKSNPIRKGIENRFSRETLEKAKKHKPEFIDITGKHPVTNRGVDKMVPEQWTVNEDEKTNLCDWLCEKGEAEDFESFQEILDKLNEILGRFQSTSDQN